jgi:hypothetical protein
VAAEHPASHPQPAGGGGVTAEPKPEELTSPEPRDFPAEREAAGVIDPKGDNDE